LAKVYNCQFFEASAKQRIKVDETFYGMVREIRTNQENQKKQKQFDEKEVSLCCILM
jgi:hypothetical protein